MVYPAEGMLNFEPAHQRLELAVGVLAAVVRDDLRR
jgi:hypothetical protein